MKADRAMKLCERLRQLADLRPGANPDALSEVRGIVTLFREEPNINVSGKAAEVLEYFKVWFSPRRWKRSGELRAWENLKSSISNLRTTAEIWLK